MKKVRDFIIKAITQGLLHIGLFLTVAAEKFEDAAKYMGTFSLKEDFAKTKNDFIEFLGKSKKWFKDFKFSNYTKKQKYVFAIFCALFLVITSNDIQALSQNLISTKCKVIYVDGQEVAKIPEVIDGDIVETLNAELTSYEGRPVQITSDIDIEEGRGFGYEINHPEETIEKIKNEVEYSVLATDVIINDEHAFYADNMVEVLNILNEIKAPYEDPKYYKVDFKEEFTYNETYAPVDEVLSEEEIKDYFASNKQDKIVHTVVEGDTLWDLSMEYEVTVQDIVDANPELTEETILQLDDEIVISNEVPTLSVRTYERVVYEDVAPYEVQKVERDDQYVTYSNVVTPGVNGVKKVTADIVSDNGVQTDKLIVSEEIITPPVTEVVEVGTMNTPPKSAIGTFKWPASGSISDRFMTRGGKHKGIDIANSAGTPIKASDGGVVTYAGWDGSGYGNLVIIDHENGYQTYYAHNSKIYVTPGQRVAQGEVIAAMGSTGRSTGNHCHFEVRKNGVPQNPFDYLTY